MLGSFVGRSLRAPSEEGGIRAWLRLCLNKWGSLTQERKLKEKKKGCSPISKSHGFIKPRWGRGRINPSNQEWTKLHAGSLNTRLEYPPENSRSPRMSFGDRTLDWRTRGRRCRQLQTIKLLERERGRESKPFNQRSKQKRP